jgi:predicted methyltransferase MtxX (methanogen marker protein 4)
MKLSELKALTKYCRSIGIIHYKTADVEFTLSPVNPKEERSVEKKIRLAEKSAMEKLATMSEEEILLYSSSSFNDKDL